MADGDGIVIAPPPSTPSLWFVIDGAAYRLDDPGAIGRMGPRHRELCLALIRYSTDGRDAPDDGRFTQPTHTR